MSIHESDSAEPTRAQRHTIPAIDRMMEVLGWLERSPADCTISDIASGLGLPRTSVYRILNSLEMHGMVRRGGDGQYRLGQRILALANRVRDAAASVDISAIAGTHLSRIAAETGYSVKLSTLDADGVLVVAVAQGKREYALSVTPGQKLPVHAGAAAKLLLAHASEADREMWLARPLKAFTRYSLIKPARLRSELQKILRTGWAFDRGESTLGICAFAAPVYDGKGRLVAALSIPFVSATGSEEIEQLRLAVVEGARALSAAIATSGA